MKTTIVIPTYNEAENLPKLVSAIFSLPAPDLSLLIVDDNSHDGTGQIADQISRETGGRLRVMHRAGKLGLGTAYVQGFRAALAGGYRYVVEMDSDGSHLPEQLPDLLAAARAGAGLVMGSRWIAGGRISGWPWHRRWISRTGTRVARLALRSRLHDITSGFRVIDARWLSRVDLARIGSHGYGFQVELAWTLERMGCPIAEVPITFVERRIGRSKMSLGIVLEALARVLTWGWQLRFAPSRLPRPVRPAAADETPAP